MLDLEAIIAFVMEDRKDFRRRLVLADYYEANRMHHAAKRQRDFVTFMSRLKDTDYHYYRASTSILMFVHRKNRTDVLYILRKDGSIKQPTQQFLPFRDAAKARRARVHRNHTKHFKMLLARRNP